MLAVLDAQARGDSRGAIHAVLALMPAGNNRREREMNAEQINALQADLEALQDGLPSVVFMVNDAPHIIDSDKAAKEVNAKYLIDALASARDSLDSIIANVAAIRRPVKRGPRKPKNGAGKPATTKSKPEPT